MIWYAETIKLTAMSKKKCLMKKQTDKPGNIHCSTAVHMANLVNMLSESEYKLCFLGATKIKKKQKKTQGCGCGF